MFKHPRPSAKADLQRKWAVCDGTIERSQSDDKQKIKNAEKLFKLFVEIIIKLIIGRVNEANAHYLN